MARKTDYTRKIDLVPENRVLAGAPDESTEDLAPPLPNTALEPPTNLALTPLLIRSASTPMGGINATWDAPTGITFVDKYTVQWSENSGFPAGATFQADTPFEGAQIDHLKTLTFYYVRVSAWEHNIQSKWSTAAST